MAVTYYVALPFIRTEDGTAPDETQECQSESTLRSGGPKDCHGILPMLGPSHSSVQAIRTLASFRTRSY
jgi:hypothetical protein